MHLAQTSVRKNAKVCINTYPQKNVINPLIYPQKSVDSIQNYP